MPRMHELGIFTRPNPDPRVMDEVDHLSGQTTHMASITEPLPWVLPKRIITIGGESTTRTIVQRLEDTTETRPVGLIPHGSHTVTYQLLLEAGRAMTMEEFMDTDPQSFPEEYLVRPGLFATTAMLNHAATGRFERNVGTLNENILLRTLPNHRREKAARLLAALPATLQPGKRIHMYSVSPKIGAVNAFTQDFFGDEVTLATIEGSYPAQIAKLWKTLVAWSKNERPDPSILHVERRASFVDQTYSPTVWVDGETHTNTVQGEFVIRRGNRTPMVAIIPDY